MKAVSENNWNFDDAQALAPDFVGEFDLKAVTVGTNAIDVDRLERGAAKAFEAAGRVGERHARNDADVFRGAEAEHEAIERPIDHADAI